MALIITDEQNYQNIADAIRIKLGSSDTFLPSEMADAIDSIPQGAASEGFKTKFIDYDGTLLYEYTQEEVDELTELPPLPSHAGLICQEWNWSLADIKAMGRQVIVGANYITDDGRTRIYIDIPEYDKTVYSNYTQSQRGGVRIHWGDGTTFVDEGNTTVSTSHTYENSGNYKIEIEVLNGTISISGDSTLGSKLIWSNQPSSAETTGAANYVSKIEIGSGVILGGPAFKGMNIETVSIPSDLEFALTGGSYFASNRMLKCLVLPKTLTQIRSNLANSDYSLKIVSIANTVTSIQSYAFNNCFSLMSLIIPDTVTSIKEYAFTKCGSIEELIIPERAIEIGESSFAYVTGLNRINAIPEGITDFPSSCFRGSDIGSLTFDNENLSFRSYAFNECTKIKALEIKKTPDTLVDLCFEYLRNLETIYLPEGLEKVPNCFFEESQALNEISIPSTVTEIGKSAFKKCSSLRDITLPAGLRTIGESAFDNCRCLREIIIPAGVTKLSTNLFSYCNELRSVTCLGNIETIASNSPFRNCPNILVYDFSHCTSVPSCSSSSFITVNSRTVIKVPADLYNDFSQAQYWSNYASYMVAV